MALLFSVMKVGLPPRRRQPTAVPRGQPHPSRGCHMALCARAASRGARARRGGCSGGSSLCCASRPHGSGMVPVRTYQSSVLSLPSPPF